MTPEQALAHAVAYCDHKLPKWLPWQAEALQKALSLTIGWGTFRRRITISVTTVAEDLDRKIYALAYLLIADIQLAASQWIADAIKPSAQERADEWLRKAGPFDGCVHPDEYRSLPMDDNCYCLQCGARLPIGL